MRILFEKLDGVTKEQIETGKIRPHFKFCGTPMIFNIKMNGKFTRKARLVADLHKADDPSSISYSSVVSRDNVRICLMAASLNNLDVFACSIGNAYLNANRSQKLWTIVGTKFDCEKGAVMLIVRRLYGLKSSEAVWRVKLAETIHDLGYVPTQVDPDVRMMRAVKDDGTPYYKYMRAYVNDSLHIT